MKSFLYTLAILASATAFAQANTETTKPATTEEVVLEEVSTENTESEPKKEETK
ncbi:MAG: hypothetical protein K2Y08_05180 [Alphaproteobacteria bacterium]|nr:hypothetical protein [Alphaproteobacteria bacterium]